MPAILVSCNDLTQCRIKVAGAANCDGTVFVGCDQGLTFFVDGNGNVGYSIYDDRRRSVSEVADAEAAEADAAFSSLVAGGGDVTNVEPPSSFGEVVEDLTSSRLRGAKRAGGRRGWLRSG